MNPDTEKAIGTARWLWDMGHVDVTAEQSLMLFGYCHPKVLDVELVINQNVNPMTIHYRLVVSAWEAKKYRAYRSWMDYWVSSKSILGKIIRNWSLEKIGLGRIIDHELLMKRQVETFLGPEVPITVEVVS
jgi:hypothetical protein